MSSLAALVESFRAPGIAFLIGGSVASSIHGISRATMDVDVLADIRQEHVESWCAAIEHAFHVDKQTVAECVRTRRAFNVLARDALYKFAVFLPTTRFHYSELRRAEETTFDFFGSTMRCPVATAEDILLAKLDWYRLGGGVSDSQWRDIGGIVQTQASRLDLGYLRDSASDIGIADLLERALAVS